LLSSFVAQFAFRMNTPLLMFIGRLQLQWLYHPDGTGPEVR
jgi:hypothetical protein